MQPHQYTCLIQDAYSSLQQHSSFLDHMWSQSKHSGVGAALTMGAPGVPQLVGATLGIQLAPPVSFFSICGSLEANNHTGNLCHYTCDLKESAADTVLDAQRDHTCLQ